MAGASAEKEEASVPANTDRVQFLEALFTEQNAKSCEELALLRSSILELSSRMGSGIALRDLRYLLVDGRKPTDPLKLHQLRSSCHFAPSWAWRSRCGLKAGETVATSRICTESDVRLTANVDPCLVCSPDCMRDS